MGFQMGNVFYIHRVSKIVDELVRQNSLVLTLHDGYADGLSLTDHLQALQQIASNLGVRFEHETQSDGATIVIFKPR